MPTFAIRHLTTYRYKAPVAFGEHRMILRPRDSFDQATRRFRLAVTPKPDRLSWAQDASGNLVGTARFGRRARELCVEARAEVDVVPFRQEDLALAEHARTCPFSYGAEEMPDLARFIERQHPDPDHAVDRWARSIRETDPARDSWTFLCNLNAAIRRDFAYLRREEKGVQDPAQTLRLGRGSCRDFAVLMTEAVRALGFAARFVSGYLHVHGRGPAIAQGGGSTHAWLQVYVPGGGWIDFDPTSGAVGNGDLVRVATVRAPDSAAPLSGSFLGFPSDFLAMEVEVAIEMLAPAANGRERPAKLELV